MLNENKEVTLVKIISKYLHIASSKTTASSLDTMPVLDMQ